MCPFLATALALPSLQMSPNSQLHFCLHSAPPSHSWPHLLQPGGLLTSPETVLAEVSSEISRRLCSLCFLKLYLHLAPLLFPSRNITSLAF